MSNDLRAARIQGRSPGFWHLPLLTLISGLVFFVQLGGSRLWDVDEAIFAETAREMFERRDAIVPYFNGHLFTHKPPLMYWGMMAAFQLLGATAFAARSASALFGMASVIATYFLGRRLFSPGAGLWAGIVLSTCLQFPVIARAATPDAPLVLFSTLAMLAIVYGTSTWQAPRSPSPQTNSRIPASQTPLPKNGTPKTTTLAYALAYGAMGIGALAKGPVAVVLPTAVWCLFLLCAIFEMPAPLAGRGRFFRLGWNVLAFCSPMRFLRTVWQMRPLLALSVVLLVAGPWYVLVGIETDGQWLSEFFGVHNLGRFWHPMDNHRGPLIYYLLAVLGGLFPWSIFLSPMSWHLIRRLRSRDAQCAGDLLLACWIAVWIGFFSLASTKLPSYIAPAYPALALVAGRFVQQWLTAPESVARGWLNAAFAVLGVVGVTTMIALPIVLEFLLTRQHEYAWALAGLPLLLGAAVAWRSTQRGQPRAAAYAMTAAATVFVVALLGFGASHVDEFQTTPPVSELILESSPGADPVITSYHFFRPSFVFYTRHPVGELDSPAAARAFFEDHPDNAFLITTEVPYEHLQFNLPPDVKILDVRPRFPRPREFPYKDNMVLLGRVPKGNAPDRRAAIPAVGSNGPKTKSDLR
jgi:4-amino-4-deoxy-L-arabinose transferase-like glycosyltransferase